MEHILAHLRFRALPHLHHISNVPTTTPVRAPPLSNNIRTLHTTRPLNSPLPKPHQFPPRPKINEQDITESFLKGSGPGGQKINKTSSAVQLTHLPTGTVLKCQATRSRIQNRKIARQLIAQKIENLELGEGSREGVKGQIRSERKARGGKKRRRKYRALDERRAQGEGVGVEGREGIVEEGEEGQEVEDGSDAAEGGNGGVDGRDMEQKSHGQRKREDQQRARERYEHEGNQQDTVNKLFEEARERMQKQGKG